LLDRIGQLAIRRHFGHPATLSGRWGEGKESCQLSAFSHQRKAISVQSLDSDD
jgi:hypothetical protein